MKFCHIPLVTCVTCAPHGLISLLMSSAGASQVISLSRVNALQEEDTSISDLSPFLCLLILQLIDLKFTYAGITIFGTSAEGNPIFHLLFPLLGTFLSLALAKSFAIAMIAALYIFRQKVLWLNPALWGISAVYLFAAVIPWSYLLWV